MWPSRTAIGNLIRPQTRWLRQARKERTAGDQSPEADTGRERLGILRGTVVSWRRGNIACYIGDRHMFGELLFASDLRIDPLTTLKKTTTSGYMIAVTESQHSAAMNVLSAQPITDAEHGVSHAARFQEKILALPWCACSVAALPWGAVEASSPPCVLSDIDPRG